MEVKYGRPLEVQEIKATGDAFEVSGYASTFGNVDRGADVVLRTAFDATLASGSKVRFLRQHNPDAVLGIPTALKTDDHGLFGTFKISKTPLGEETYQLLKDGALDSFSIGYVTEDADYDDTGVRLLKRVELIEVSIVAVPMNTNALVTGVKFNKDQPFDLFINDVTDALEVAVQEAKALVQRRKADHRALPERHVDAARAALARAKALSDELDALVAVTPPTPPTLAKAAGGLALRLELARRRVRMAGIELE